MTGKGSGSNGGGRSVKVSVLRLDECQRGPGLGEVFLNVYDVRDNFAVVGVNSVLRAVGAGGAFHAGVQVYGREWTFSGRPFPPSACGSGLTCGAPRSSWGHCYRETVRMGWTPFSEVEASLILKELLLEWQASSYDWLRRNCLHFCEALCVRLRVGVLPSWVLSLPSVAADLEQLKEDATCSSCNRRAPVMAASTSLPVPGYAPALEGPRVSRIGRHRPLPLPHVHEPVDWDDEEVDAPPLADFNEVPSSVTPSREEYEVKMQDELYLRFARETAAQNLRVGQENAANSPNE